MTIRQRLCRDIEDVHVVDPTMANACRLHAAYQRAFLEDETLATCIRCDHPINGMTEHATPETFQRYLEMPSTMAFEIPPLAGTGAPQSFVIARFCNAEKRSRSEFRDYYLNEVFDGETPKYHSKEDRSLLEQAFEVGNMLYLVEFVGRGGKVATTCLLLAVFREICRRRLGTRDCQIVGKCLDSASLTGHCNTVGNAAIKRMTETFELRQIAIGTQRRLLRISPDGETAYLHFGLYLGRGAYLARLLDSLPERTLR